MIAGLRTLQAGDRFELEVIDVDSDPLLEAQYGELVPVLMGYWFAPVLAAWRGMSAAQSLFYSFFATLRNWRAFLVYSLAFVVIGGIMPTLVLIIALALRPTSAVLSSILIYSMVPAVLTLVPTLFASFYTSYIDIFTEAAAEKEPDNPSQS